MRRRVTLEHGGELLLPSPLLLHLHLLVLVLFGHLLPARPSPMSALLAPEPGRMTADAPITARGCDSFRGALRHGFHTCEHVDCHCGECEHVPSRACSLSGDSIGTSLALDAIWLRQIATVISQIAIVISQPVTKPIVKVH